MFSTKLLEYLKKTHEEKRSLNPNIRKQYDFQIREKVKEALDHFNLLLSFHSEDQLKKIFSDESHAFSELIKDLNKRVMPPEDFEAHEELKNQFLYSPALLQEELVGLDIQEEEVKGLKQFLEEQGLLEKYTSDLIQKERAHQAELMKARGWSDERINAMLTRLERARMKRMEREGGEKD